MDIKNNIFISNEIMGFGIFKKIKNGNKSVAGRLKKKAAIEGGNDKPSWKWGEPAPPPKMKPITKNNDFPELEFKDDFYDDNDNDISKYGF